MNQPPDQTPSPEASVRRRPLVRRLLLAPEAGLVLVILVMGAVLAIASYGEETGPAVAFSPEAQITQTDEGIVVENDPRAGTYLAADGWSFDIRRRTFPAGSTFERTPDGTIITPPEGRRVRVGPEQDVSTLEDGTLVAQRAIAEQTVNRSSFLKRQNLQLVAESASIFAIMAVGAAAVIILAGIDLSVGSIYALAGVAGGIVLRELDPGTSAVVAIPLAAALCVGAGAVCGFVNGVGVVLMKVHPFVITLSTMAVYRGVALVMTGGDTVDGVPASVPASLDWRLVAIYSMVACALIGAFVYTRTVFGRRIFAVGGNEVAARYAGVPVNRIRIMVFTIAGALGGLAALMALGRFGAAEASAGMAYELKVIAAAVIGGTSLAGGRGSAIGAVLGAIIIALIENAFVVMRIPAQWSQVVFGVTIVIAVAIDRAKTGIQHRKS